MLFVTNWCQDQPIKTIETQNAKTKHKMPRNQGYPCPTLQVSCHGAALGDPAENNATSGSLALGFNRIARQSMGISVSQPE